MELGLSTLIALVAVVLAWQTRRQAKALSARVTALESRLGQGPDIVVTEAAADPDAAPEAIAPEAEPPASDAPSPAWSPPGLDLGAALGGFGQWLKANWIYPVAGLALVMAAIYLVQYSIDKGLLSPTARVALAVLLGAGLIAGAELLRRRWGDGAGGARHVPATLSGAGIAALFAAVLSAYHLYDLIGQGTTLIALALVALLALALGWVQGPLLAAIGVLAGTAAPFLLGEGGAPRPLLYAYFGTIAALGLAIGGLRRWGWVAGLAVVAPLAAAATINAAGAPPDGLAALILIVVALALALPGGALIPRAEGPMLHQALRQRPAPEVLVAGIAVILGAAILITQVEAPPSLIAAGLLAIMVPLWTWRAPALADLALPAALGLPLVVAASLITTPLFLSMGLNLHGWLPLAAVAFAALAGLAMLWRSEGAEGRARDLWALLGVATPLATTIAVEVFWQPLTLLQWRWPATVMALAAAMTALASWAARRDAGQGARLGAAAAAAFTLAALAMMLMLSAAALTLALAVLLIAAALMDRRFGIPMLGVVVGLGAMTMGWRLVIDPGLDPLLTAAYGSLDTWLTIAAVLLGPLAALVVMHGAPPHPVRDWGRIVAETALSGMVPVVLVVIFARFLDQAITPHAGMGIEASALFAMASVQAERARRMQGSRAMHAVRIGLCVVLSLAAFVCLAAGMTVLSPLLNGGGFAGRVLGSPVFNDLMLAYLAPALVLWWALRNARSRLMVVARAIPVLVGAYWVFTAIRHLWHGSERMGLNWGYAQGELYAYTVALLAAGAGSMALALRQGRTGWRILGLALIGLAAAKAFLIDAAGLNGLMRVGAFLGLGLSLAALAWLNAWVIARMPAPEVESKG